MKWRHIPRIQQGSGPHVLLVFTQVSRSITLQPTTWTIQLPCGLFLAPNQICPQMGYTYFFNYMQKHDFQDHWGFSDNEVRNGMHKKNAIYFWEHEQINHWIWGVSLKFSDKPIRFQGTPGASMWSAKTQGEPAALLGERNPSKSLGFLWGAASLINICVLLF